MSRENLDHIMCSMLLWLFLSSIRTSYMEKWVQAWDQVMKADKGFGIIILVLLAVACYH